MNKIHIMQEQWDYLIILDACRYDYFEQTWGNYFDEGKLSKKISVGTATYEWRGKAFTEYYPNTVYISANPYINSIAKLKGFLGSEHFYKVYDIWESGWNKELGTVLPETVTNASIDIIKSHRDKRVIIHYLQPHAPYLSLRASSQGFPIPNLSEKKVLMGTDEHQSESKLQKFLFNLLLPLVKKSRLFGNHPHWYLKEILNMPPESPMDAVRRKYGKKKLRKAYQANLESVFEQVTILAKHLSGTMVITSDHGELLGENRCYSHSQGSSNRLLREVPWLVLEKPKKNVETVNISNIKEGLSEKSPEIETDHSEIQENLVEKLKSLGYFE